jgi:integrase
MAATNRIRHIPSDWGSEYRSIRACRDRALVYVLAYTAVRGAEIFRDSTDERHDGLRWSDVDLDAQSMTVFRKKQQWDEASIPAPVLSTRFECTSAFSIRRLPSGRSSPPSTIRRPRTTAIDHDACRTFTDESLCEDAEIDH